MHPPLRWVNSYILRGSNGVTIIDPGPHIDGAEEEWEKSLKHLRLSASDIAAIVLTHHHPDHYGLSGWFQQMSNAPVFMSERAHKEAKLMWGQGNTMSEQIVSLFRQHGMTDDLLSPIPVHLQSFFTQVTPQPEVSYIVPDVPFVMGDRSWIPISTSGHAPGHISFYDEYSGEIICGDAVLPQISPNVSLLPNSDPQPLKSYMEGLHKLNQYAVEQAYPGHRGPFTHYHERIESLLIHHQERLNSIYKIIEQSPQTGFEVCTSLFGTNLSTHQMRFAMSEALAHLAELERQGRIREERDASDLIRFVSN
nr:MBL fold metallo-hydrolase [Paenibacillus sediminis]